ncbi:hypothetical protein [Acrocarpospora sp. B8E8]|uniref:hypothetical protein n=1 Tax=Acrocarpospora sp. B8E8 TaxID=3153572 RepID=UPI00325DAA27
MRTDDRWWSWRPIASTYPGWSAPLPIRISYSRIGGQAARALPVGSEYSARSPTDLRRFFWQFRRLGCAPGSELGIDRSHTQLAWAGGGQ